MAVQSNNTSPAVDDAFAAAFNEITAADGGTPKKPDEPADTITDTAQANNDAAVEDAAQAAAAAAGTGAEAEDDGLPDPAAVAAEAARLAADNKHQQTPAAQAQVKEPPAAGGLTPEQQAAADANLIKTFRESLTVPAVKEPVKEEPRQAPALTEYTAEQKSVVDAYMKEWPDVYQAEQLIRMREYQALTNHIFAQLAPVLQSLQGSVGEISTTTHMSQLEQAVPDLATVGPQIAAWVKEQPAYLQPAYNHVVEKGNVQDVIDLVGRWRVATNTPVPTVKEPATTQQQDPAVVEAARVAAEVAKNPNAQRALKGLVPVRSKQSGVQQDGVSMDDFDGAFAAAAAAA